MPRVDPGYFSKYDKLGAIKELRRGAWGDCGPGSDLQLGEVPVRLSDGSIWYFTMAEWQQYVAAQRQTATQQRQASPQPVLSHPCPLCSGTLRPTSSNDSWQCDRCTARYTSQWVDNKKRDRVQPICIDPAGRIPLDDFSREICHVVHHGSPLCEFSHERPSDWPKGHVWAPLDAIRHRREGDEAAANCQPCLIKALELIK